MDSTVFAILLSKIKGIQSGLKTAKVTGVNTVQYEYDNGTKLDVTLTVPKPEYTVDYNTGHLQYTLKNQ